MLHSSAYILSFNPQSNPVRSAVICCMLRLGSHALHLWRPCPPFAGRTRWVPRRLGHLSRELTLGRYEQLTPPLGSGVLRSEREIRKKPHFSIQQVFPEAGAGLGTAEVNQRVLPWKFTVWPEGRGPSRAGTRAGSVNAPLPECASGLSSSLHHRLPLQPQATSTRSCVPPAGASASPLVLNVPLHSGQGGCLNCELDQGAPLLGTLWRPLVARRRKCKRPTLVLLSLVCYTSARF